MNDPLGGSPIRDVPGTVRGDAQAGAWVKVGHLSQHDRDMWVSTTHGEQVSDHTMWLLNLGVLGAVPQSLADDRTRVVERTRADMLDGFLVSVREYVAGDQLVDEHTTDDDLLTEFVEILHALSERAREQGKSLLQAARGDTVEPDLPRCEEELVGSRCLYDGGHPGPHSFQGTHDGKRRCPSYGDRPCVYPADHEGRHSYEGKCQERAADGRLCDLGRGHEPETPHDWMNTFGNPKIRCRSIWTEPRDGYNRVWRCMFEEDHDGDCSFVLRQRGAVRCGVRNEQGAQCWRRSGHGEWHRYLEATRERL